VAKKKKKIETPKPKAKPERQQKPQLVKQGVVGVGVF